MPLQFVTSPARWAARIHPLGNLKLVKPMGHTLRFVRLPFASAYRQTDVPRHSARQYCRVTAHM